MRFKRLLIWVILISLVLVSAGCKKEEQKNITIPKEDLVQKVDYKPEYGGQLILPLTSLDTLNPLVSENRTYYHFSKLIFEGLFELDKDLNAIGILVDSHTVEEDGTVKIQLKDGVYWHDGMELTTADVAFTIETIKYAGKDNVHNKLWQDALGAFQPYNMNRIIRVDVIDDRNMDIIFDRNYGQCLELLTFPIIPKHRFAQGIEGRRSYEMALSKEEYNPIGTGPYKFKDHEKNREVKL
ncbi:MAG: peptide ABC transporter substrate-binding protein, partial [Tissierellia bacterium]|nr:peptide ABC transporter substrate-binding protein [Tissierellia bacterium]